MKFELETHFKIYDERGDFVEIRPDRDGLGMIEITKDKTTLVFEKDQAKLVIAALQNLV